MPLFELHAQEPDFPPAQFADSQGLLAVGGQLTAEWLIAAYRSGLYLWCSPMEPLQWWSPDPRIVLFPEELKVPEYIEQLTTKTELQIQLNSPLARLIDFCQNCLNKPPMSAEWLTGAFAKSYLELEKKKLVRSATVWLEGKLVGGAFGSLLEKVFFGEYVCQTAEGMAELALIALTRHLQKEGAALIDLHKDSMATDDIGYREISRAEFLSFLKKT